MFPFLFLFFFFLLPIRWRKMYDFFHLFDTKLCWNTTHNNSNAVIFSLFFSSLFCVLVFWQFSVSHTHFFFFDFFYFPSFARFQVRVCFDTHRNEPRASEKNVMRAGANDATRRPRVWGIGAATVQSIRLQPFCRFDSRVFGLTEQFGYFSSSISMWI